MLSLIKPNQSGEATKSWPPPLLPTLKMWVRERQFRQQVLTENKNVRASPLPVGADYKPSHTCQNLTQKCCRRHWTLTSDHLMHVHVDAHTPSYICECIHKHTHTTHENTHIFNSKKIPKRFYMVLTTKMMFEDIKILILNLIQTLYHTHICIHIHMEIFYDPITMYNFCLYKKH